jgi:FtsH-binding integral membrane protein
MAVQEGVVEQSKWSDKAHLRWLTLFITGSTLLCCALPILLVSLGFGAVVASLNYNIPGLLFLAEHKQWTLILSALLLVGLAWVIWRPNQRCPADAELATYCQTAKCWNKRVFWLSAGIWCIGFFASVLLLPLRQFFDF